MAGIFTPGTGADFHYRGTTDGGAPSSGSFAVGDWVETPTGIVVCQIGGSPGTWSDLALTPTTVAVSAAPLSGSPTDPTITYGNFVAAGNGATFPLAEGRYLYVTIFNDNKIYVFDLNDRDNPVKVGEVTVGSGPSHLAKRGKYLFVMHQNDATVKSVDVSDPTAPTVTNSLSKSAGTGGQRMALNGRYLLVGGPESGTINTATVVDTINPAALVELSSLTFGSTHRTIVPLGPNHFGVVSRDDNTFNIIDISNPFVPVVAGSLAGLTNTLTPAAVDPLFNEGRPYVYLSAYTDGKFYVVDCSDPANPRLQGSLTGSLNGEWITIVGRYAFVVCRLTHAVDVIDIANPAKPLLISQNVIAAATRTDRGAYTNGRLYVTETTNVGGVHTLAVTGGKVQAVTPQTTPIGVRPNNVQVFTANGTWTKPPDAKAVEVHVISAGSGGGSGRKGAAGTVRCGGGGGGAGALSFSSFNAADLAATVGVVVGVGGAGGAAQATNSTDGQGGSNGGVSYFGASAAAALVAAGVGSAGGGGTAAAGSAGGNGAGTLPGANGAAASTTGLVGAAGSQGAGGSGGGSGGGITSADAASAGGAGAVPATRRGATAPAGGAIATNGNPGTTTGATSPVVGSSGSGGGSSIVGNAGTGGAGSIGSGGGGGGAALDSTGNSGAGGAGGNGLVVIVTRF